MSNTKGMSQVLVLIVAAAVLMMVGLLLISMGSNSLTDTFNSVNNAGCQQQLESTCDRQNPDDGTISAGNLPSSCQDSIAPGEEVDNYECPS